MIRLLGRLPVGSVSSLSSSFFPPFTDNQAVRLVRLFPSSLTLMWTFFLWKNVINFFFVEEDCSNNDEEEKSLENEDNMDYQETASNGNGYFLSLFPILH